MARVSRMMREVKLNYFSGPFQPKRLGGLFLILLRGFFLLVDYKLYVDDKTVSVLIYESEVK